MSPEAAVGHWRDERVFWRRELVEVGRGLRQLKQLRARALADPESTSRKVDQLLLAGEVDELALPADHGMVSEADLVDRHYSKLIAAYELRLMEAERNVWVATARCRTLSLTRWPVHDVVQRANGARPRARESRPTRRARRGAAVGDRPRPSDDDDEPHDRVAAGAAA